MELNKILHQDCLEGLRALPDNCIDCCVTDPPYGIRFMGKKWDYEIPGVSVWEEVLRVIKPGGHILVACGTRTQHRMAVNIEDAGFEIRDVICWHYGSGFPKSLDISKAIDKSAGAEREVIGARKSAASSKTESLGVFNALYNETVASCEQAQKWDGWGSALKPATEFWTLARKPLSEKTIAQNVIKHGTGGLNIDACRIEGGSDYHLQDIETRKMPDTNGIYGKGLGQNKSQANDSGRFPANVILDDFMAEEMDRQSWELKAGGNITTVRSSKTKGIYGDYKGGQLVTGCGDTGGASRFFYVAKPSTEERGDTKHPTVKPQTIIQYLIKLICPIEAGRIVLDPFAGSGSHCIAAMKLGLDFVAYEMEEHSCKEANDRLRKEMGLFGTAPTDDPEFCMNGGEY